MCMWAIVVHVDVLTISEQRAVGIMGFRNIAMEPSHTTLSVPHKSPPPPAVCVCGCVSAWVMLCCVLMEVINAQRDWRSSARAHTHTHTHYPLHSMSHGDTHTTPCTV